MLFLNFGSNNVQSSIPVLIPDRAKPVDNPEALCAAHCHLLQGKGQEQKLSYSTLRRLWQLGRSSSEPRQKVAQRPVERRTSYPEETHEMKTLVDDQTRCCQQKRGGALSFRFWRTDKDGDYLAAARHVDVASAADIDTLSELMQNRIVKRNCSVTDIAEMVQNTYKIIDSEMRKKVVFSCLTPAKRDSMIISFEEQFMKNFHLEIFTKITKEEQENDKALSSKIESFFWITLKHLDAKADETDPATWRHLDRAMLDLAGINFRESVVEKLACIMKCSRKIFDVLNAGDQEGGADGFLPILIYVVLQANPAHLHSNIRYILQFANTDRVMKGEEGYYFTHLCSVVSYIENLNPKSLGMTDEEFTSYTSSSDALGVGYDQPSLARFICRVYHSSAEQQALTEKQESLRKRSESLLHQIEQMTAELASCQAECERRKEEVGEMSVEYRKLPPETSCPRCLHGSTVV